MGIEEEGMIRVIGMEVGVVTNTRITHATPAALYARVSDGMKVTDMEGKGTHRDHEGTTEEGCVSIARQLLRHPADKFRVGENSQLMGDWIGTVRWWNEDTKE